jgi:alpha-beta hydrolase superfamily lysophospholipase
LPVNGGLPRPGALATIDAMVYAGNPSTAHGLPYEEVAIPTPAGPAPGWQVPGEGPDWAIITHGKGAGRIEALRIIPSLHRAGLNTLTISYANDPGASPGPRGHYGYGAHEWRDLEAAVAHAERQGAGRIVLVGFSMGAAITLGFLRNSEKRTLIHALIFEAPVQSLVETVEHYATERRIPRAIVGIGKRVAGLRFGVDWTVSDYRGFARELELPLLLFHGDNDVVVPVRFSDEFAAACPHIEYHRMPGAYHMGCWNADQETYESCVESFLLRTLSG